MKKSNLDLACECDRYELILVGGGIPNLETEREVRSKANEFMKLSILRGQSG